MKKILLISLPVVIIVLAAAAYLFGAPTLQTNSYKVEAKANQLALASNVDKAIDVAKQDAFFDENVTIAEAKNAVKTSEDAASNLEAKIQNNEKGLTNFAELPFVSTVNPNYKTTLEHRSLEEKYVKLSKEYLTEFKSVNTYNKQTLPVIEISNEMASISKKLATAKSPAAMQTLLDELLGRFNKLNKITASVKPAESVKESHDLSKKALLELTVIVKDLKAALQALDIEKLMTLSAAYDKKVTITNKETKKLEHQYLTESKLMKLGDELNNLNKQIDTKTAKL